MSERYRNKQVEVEAVQWTGENREDIREFVGDSTQLTFGATTLLLWSGTAYPGGFVIRNPRAPDKVFVRSEAEFKATYEPAGQERGELEKVVEAARSWLKAEHRDRRPAYPVDEPAARLFDALAAYDAAPAALAVDAWCLIRGRLTFVHADRTPSAFNAGAPSLLLACGSDCVEALSQSRLGITVGVNETVALAQASIFAQPPEPVAEISGGGAPLR